MESIKFIDSVGAIHYTSKPNGRGTPHRIGGPAWQHGEDKEWWVNGERHREDGPAIEHEDGHKEWFLNGVSYSEEEFNAVSKDLSTNKKPKL